MYSDTTLKNVFFLFIIDNIYSNSQETDFFALAFITDKDKAGVEWRVSIIKYLDLYAAYKTLYPMTPSHNYFHTILSNFSYIHTKSPQNFSLTCRRPQAWPFSIANFTLIISYTDHNIKLLQMFHEKYRIVKGTDK